MLPGWFCPGSSRSGALTSPDSAPAASRLGRPGADPLPRRRIVFPVALGVIGPNRPITMSVPGPQLSLPESGKAGRPGPKLPPNLRRRNWVQSVGAIMPIGLAGSTRRLGRVVPDQATPSSSQCVTTCSRTRRGTAPLPSTVPWKARMSKPGPSRCWARSRSRRISLRPIM